MNTLLRLFWSAFTELISCISRHLFTCPLSVELLHTRSSKFVLLVLSTTATATQSKNIIFRLLHEPGIVSIHEFLTLSWLLKATKCLITVNAWRWHWNVLEYLSLITQKACVFANSFYHRRQTKFIWHNSLATILQNKERDRKSVV